MNGGRKGATPQLALICSAAQKMQVSILEKLIKEVIILLGHSKFIIIVFFAFYSCSGNVDDRSQSNTSDLNKENNILLEKINEFVSHVDSININGAPSPEIVIVSFNSLNDSCVINIYTQFYYNSKLLNGYIIIKDKMIAFYSIDNYCNKGFLNSVKLRKEVGDKFPDENSGFAELIYESIIWSYKLIDGPNNKLELIPFIKEEK